MVAPPLKMTIMEKEVNPGISTFGINEECRLCLESPCPTLSLSLPISFSVPSRLARSVGDGQCSKNSWCPKVKEEKFAGSSWLIFWVFLVM